ncbi:unnamed protein product [Macrosiphum euphorbiae]|uniref:Uncharacterized protein n=1 Tax=Macrosiphum euphorbiae TaxID=13131 RepID=A0AAV0VNT3_9HEMI|nr:unnamed protein product [Macrosiphum euphorbiae]
MVRNTVQPPMTTAPLQRSWSHVLQCSMRMLAGVFMAHGPSSLRLSDAQAHDRIISSSPFTVIHITNIDIIL